MLTFLSAKLLYTVSKNDIKNGLMTANQIKLVTPSEYTGYQIAFKLLVQAKRLDEAEKELERARKYASPTMDFYFWLHDSWAWKV